MMSTRSLKRVPSDILHFAMDLVELDVKETLRGVELAGLWHLEALQRGQAFAKNLVQL